MMANSAAIDILKNGCGVCKGKLEPMFSTAQRPMNRFQGESLPVAILKSDREPRLIPHSVSETEHGDCQSVHARSRPR